MLKNDETGASATRSGRFNSLNCPAQRSTRYGLLVSRRTSADYLDIHSLARRDVLGVDCKRIRYRIAVHLHDLELVTMEVHWVVLLSHINHANQYALTSLDLEQGILQSLGERVAIDGIKAAGLVKEHSVLPIILWQPLARLYDHCPNQPFGNLLQLIRVGVVHGGARFRGHELISL